MEVRTSRFGVIDIAEDRVITLPKGVLGFPNFTRYCLLQPGDDACFFWLQSLDDPSLAFVVRTVHREPHRCGVFARRSIAFTGRGDVGQ